jgi:hypothetical protein
MYDSALSGDESSYKKYASPLLSMAGCEAPPTLNAGAFGISKTENPCSLSQASFKTQIR